MQEQELAELLDELPPINLKGLDKVKLLNRVDRKYVVPTSELPHIFRLLRKNYFVLDIDGRRAFNYLTTYFDTEDFQFFKDHHNRRKNRIKARSRTYQESDLHFFEVKMKTNSRTDKFREKLPEPFDQLKPHQAQKIKAFYPGRLEGRLSPTILNSYTRITLVNHAKTERCTIDVNLAFEDAQQQKKEIGVSDIAIIEIKQSKTSIVNGIAASLRKNGIRPMSISKYVLGLILLRPQIKHNTFKPLLLRLEKIQQNH